jgi:hypothetical protein
VFFHLVTTSDGPECTTGGSVTLDEIAYVAPQQRKRQDKSKI